jgi:pimeloyl-ACP methyl ester carboxylesterase
VKAGRPAREAFYAGGNYVGESGQERMQGAMYVEHLRPPETTQPWPVVLFHGSGQTAMSWLTTPDGREGWAPYFLNRGFEVFLVDQPARGRSAWHAEVDGPLRAMTVPIVEGLFTATSSHQAWPQSRLHRQWPGDGDDVGRRGNPVFDQFFASQVGYVESNAETQRRVKEAGALLLDRIGPAILLTHSQAGPFGWLLADARPHLVKAIVAIEPNGPPIESSPVTGSRKQLAWGVCDIPISYAPAIAGADELGLEKQAAPDAPGLIACWQQKAPAHRLVNLQGLPILILVGEASYHAQYDHGTSNWLRQAGVDHDFVRLEDVGIRGNGHMMMLEKNNLEVAALVADWMLAHHCRRGRTISDPGAAKVRR